MFLGQTIENLRENFVNDDLIFVNKDQEELEEEDIVATGYQILKKDKNQVIDRVHIVLKGDINGDGRINALDYGYLMDHILKRSELKKSELLASELNGDDVVNALDYGILMDHILNRQLLYDPNINSTMGEGE